MIDALAVTLKHWRIIAIAALIAGLGVQTWRIDHVKAELRVTKIEAARSLDQCHANVTTLDAARQAASDSVERLKQQAAADSKANRARQEAAQAQTAGARRQVSALMAKRPTGELCASALELLREE